MENGNTSHQHQTNGRRISDILSSLADNFTTPTITIGELRNALSGRIYGIFLLVLAIPNLIPFPTPGLSAILGMPLLILTFQLMLGIHTPWFPKTILNRQIQTEHIRRLLHYVLPYLGKIENFIMPRWTWLAKYPADRAIAFLCVLLSLTIMLPVPLGNAIPALAICFFAIAILECDGLFVIVGIFFTLASIALISTVLHAAFIAALHLLGIG